MNCMRKGILWKNGLRVFCEEGKGSIQGQSEKEEEDGKER